MAYKSKEDARAYFKRWYYAHKDKRIADIRRSIKRRKERNRLYVIDFLNNHPCTDCGEKDILVLEFDHLRDKVANVSAMVSFGYKLETLVAEIKKCEVVCCNCHRRRTLKRLPRLKEG